MATGQLLRDCHTAQVPGRTALKGRQHHIRRDELSLPKHELNTVLFTRDYRQNAACAVAVVALPDALYTLADLAQALREPQFCCTWAAIAARLRPRWRHR